METKKILCPRCKKTVLAIVEIDPSEKLTDEDIQVLGLISTTPCSKCDPNFDFLKRALQ